MAISSHLTRKTNKLLGEVLIDAGMLTKEQLEMALAVQRQEGGLLGDILVKKGLITEDDVAKAVAGQYNVPFIEATAYEVNPDVLDLFPVEFLRQNNFAPVDKFNDILLLLVSTPLSSVVFGQVEKKSGCQLQCLVTSSSSLRQLHKMIGEMQERAAKRRAVHAEKAGPEKADAPTAPAAAGAADEEWASFLETVKDADFLKDLERSLDELQLTPQPPDDDEEE